MNTSASRKVLALVAALLIVGSASTTSAQYFGRNKVQYKRLNFQVLKTEHFDIYFYPEEIGGARHSGRTSPAALATMSCGGC